MADRVYRFFYHYNKPRKLMSVHFRGQCYITKNIDCWVPTESKWNKRQPYIVMQGFAHDVSWISNTEVRIS